ncbi:MAG: hypothetical protein CMJ64_13125 [Planctomycetaceae bacterium]|nr:hypothetical protein [Planctomycetaceae bacterium]
MAAGEVVMQEMDTSKELAGSSSVFGFRETDSEVMGFEVVPQYVTRTQRNHFALTLKQELFVRFDLENEEDFRRLNESFKNYVDHLFEEKTVTSEFCKHLAWLSSYDMDRRDLESQRIRDLRVDVERHIKEDKTSSTDIDTGVNVLSYFGGHTNVDIQNEYHRNTLRKMGVEFGKDGGVWIAKSLKLYLVRRGTMEGSDSFSGQIRRWSPSIVLPTTTATTEKRFDPPGNQTSRLARIEAALSGLQEDNRRQDELIKQPDSLQQKGTSEWYRPWKIRGRIRVPRIDPQHRRKA